MAFSVPTGTKDILPSQSNDWQFLEGLLLEVAAIFGFQEIRTPTFEDINLFLRSVGDTTDVVQKEIFEVKAQKSNDVFALKPEGTAGTVRAVLQNGLLNGPLPLKLFYITSCFRHERAQAGRLREFHQFGCEMFGAQSPSADAEIIYMIKHIFDMLGIKDITLSLNSIGCKTCRAEYYKALREYFSKYTNDLCGTCLERLEKNPMRILDCKSDVCKNIAKDAPIVIDYLCEDCKTHFDGVKTRLEKMEIEYSVNSKIVRGLDYYTKTVFEFQSNSIGAQSTICGGGRYDGLVEELGGNPTPALGFAIGLERLLMVMSAQNISKNSKRSCDIYIGSMGEDASIKALSLCKKLRDEGFYAECDLIGRSVKAQMKYANKIPALHSIIIGETELNTGKAKIKDMTTGEEKEIEYDNELVNILYDAMLKREADALTANIGEDAFKRIMNME